MLNRSTTKDVVINRMFTYPIFSKVVFKKIFVWRNFSNSKNYDENLCFRKIQVVCCSSNTLFGHLARERSNSISVIFHVSCNKTQFYFNFMVVTMVYNGSIQFFPAFRIHTYSCGYCSSVILNKDTTHWAV